MITVKVSFSNGDHFITRINATFEEAKDYYEGQIFNVGLGPNDNMQRCTGVELLESEVAS